MTAKKRKYLLPYDVSPKEIAVIPIAPEVAAIMLDGDENEIEAIERILEAWTELKDQDPDAEFGLHIPRKYGFSAPEEKYRADEKAAQRETAARAIELTKAIAEGKKITFSEAEKVLTQLQSGEGALSFAAEFPEIMEQAQSMADQAVTGGYKVETIFLRRAIRDWPEHLTEYLHREILESLSEFYSEEFAGVRGKLLRQSPMLAENSEQSENTLSLTGTASS
jgi:hypothetical protein